MEKLSLTWGSLSVPLVTSQRSIERWVFQYTFSESPGFHTPSTGNWSSWASSSSTEETTRARLELRADSFCTTKPTVEIYWFFLQMISKMSFLFVKMLENPPLCSFPRSWHSLLHPLSDLMMHFPALERERERDKIFTTIKQSLKTKKSLILKYKRFLWKYEWTTSVRDIPLVDRKGWGNGRAWS